MIRSNIDEVIRRLEQAQAELPARINSALNHELYLPKLKEAARFALESSGLFPPEQMGLIPHVVDAITGSSGAFNMEFILKAVSTANLLSKVDFDENGNPNWGDIPREEILQWVKEFKELKEPRDFFQKDDPEGRWKAGEPHPPEMIAMQVINAIENDPAAWINSNNTDPEAMGLKAFLGGLSELPPEALSKGLHMVLEEWILTLRLTLPEAIQQRIRNAFQQ